jgi:hypothetical protein
MHRNRIICVLLIILTLAAGLASRHFSTILPGWIHDYAGDSLWAMLVYFLTALIYTRKSSKWVALITLAVSYLIELSQLYHSPWIDNLRSFPLAGLVLGYGFLWSDLICYALGVGIGFAIDRIFWEKNR